MSETEDKANRRRWEESGAGKGSVDDWRWTLNWDSITETLIVGSCPRQPEDLDRIVDEAGASAVLSLQSDVCLEALNIDWDKIRKHAVSRGVLMARVPIRDFDHLDQAVMLSEAVRTLAVLLAFGGKVYVHCTAGINRASLTVLAYLTFVQGMHFSPALQLIKSKRQQANPYLDSWKAAKARMLEGRAAEVVELAKNLHQTSQKQGLQKDAFANWMEAESRVIQETFSRHISNSLSLVSAVTDLKAESIRSLSISHEEMEQVQHEMTSLKRDLDEEKAKLHVALEELRRLQHENGAEMAQRLSGAIEIDATEDDGTSGEDRESVYEDLVVAEQEIARLKQCLRDIAFASTEALSVSPVGNSDEHGGDGSSPF